MMERMAAGRWEPETAAALAELDLARVTEAGARRALAALRVAAIAARCDGGGYAAEVGA